jgi:4-hydroxyproline epimerase
MNAAQSVHVIDSHTEGEPTRVVISGGPDLGTGPIAERLRRYQEQFDGFRSSVICEPRGSEVVVGALLLDPVEKDSSAAVIFFNDVGYLGMCGHGTIGLITTLAHLGRIGPGWHRIETPVGIVRACLDEEGRVTVANVVSFRYRSAVEVNVPGHGSFRGDIAWGGNWFYLIGDHPYRVEPAQRADLLDVAISIRCALQEQGITGEDGAYIDHVEFFGKSSAPENSSRNFVLCPGTSFDRSPCGTGTSAKMACLYADGKLEPGEVWRQEGILGTLFEGTIEEAGNGRVKPNIRGRAWITGESKLLFFKDDPFAAGITF